MAFFAGGSSLGKAAWDSLPDHLKRTAPAWEKRLYGYHGGAGGKFDVDDDKKFGNVGSSLSSKASALRDELYGMGSSMMSSADSDYNELLRQITQEYNDMAVKEAEKARAWSASQSALDRDFNASEAEKARLWQESMTASQNQFNAAEAEKARSWQESMRNSAYQATMADMQKAGLNPILAYAQGASATPVVSSATASSVGATSSGSHSSGYSTSAASVKQRASSISFALKAMDALISSHSNSASNLSSGLGALGAVLSAVVRAFAS